MRRAIAAHACRYGMSLVREMVNPIRASGESRPEDSECDRRVAFIRPRIELSLAQGTVHSIGRSHSRHRAPSASRLEDSECDPSSHRRRAPAASWPCARYFMPKTWKTPPARHSVAYADVEGNRALH